MSDTPPPGSIRISCLLLDDRDSHHDLSSSKSLLPTRLHVDLPAAEIKEMPVSKFLLKAQDAHPICDFCFKSLPILVKSAYLLNYSIDYAHTHTRTILTLQDTVPGKLKFMTSDFPLSQFIGDDGIDAPKLTIILECTFDIARPVLKRNHSPRGSEHAHASNKRPKITLSQLAEHHPELLLLPDNENAVTPINLLPPCFPFTSYPKHTGVFLVDKSRFIPPAVRALEKYRFCTLALPPGAGKTTLVSMLQAWLDRDTDFHNLFDRLEISKGQGNNQIDNPDRRLCLMFDMKNVLLDASSASTASGISQSIEMYFCQTMKAFVDKYQKEMGGVPLSSCEQAATMIEEILTYAAQSAWRFSIFIDHWDHLIFTSLPTLKTLKNSAAACIRILAAFISTVSAVPGPDVTLLVVGNLPLIRKAADAIQMENIALLPELNGAFGVTAKELTSIYTVFRTIRPSVQLSPARAPATLGFFLPQSRTTSHKCLGFYSFSLVLHYLANQVGLNPEHKVLDSPHLKAVSQCCSNLLQYSSLRRRGHQVTIAPFHDELSFDSLLKFSKKEEALWKLLSFLGALRVCVPTRTLAARPDPMWTVEVCGDFAMTQLFGTYSYLATTNETRHQKTLRSLLERNPHPLTVDLSSFLSRIPSFGLQRMSEAAFQAILDTYMDTYLEDINGPPIASSQETTTEYHNHYFSQLGLNTACGPALRQTHVGDLKIPGQGKSGYLDAFVCGVSHLHPGRAVAMELKYINLWALIQGDDDNAPVKGAQFRTLCMQKIKQVEALSLEDLLKQRYVFRDSTTSQQRTSTVGECLQVARLQLESYLTALFKGQMLSYESVRIKCSMDRDHPDELIGYIICGIGRRVISVEVEVPGLEASSHRFEGCPDWEKKYER